MASSRITVKAPPQSLEKLDRWGSMDSLPWSLDDAVWTTAGEYALTCSEQGKSGQSSAFVRKKVLEVKGAAVVSEKAVWAGVVLLSGSGAAETAQQQAGERLRPVYAVLAGSCFGDGDVSALRIRTGEDASNVTAGGTVFSLRIRQAAQKAQASCSEVFFPVRARLLSGSGAAVGGQNAVFLRVMPFLEVESACCAEELAPYRVRMTALAGLAAQFSEKTEPNRVRCVKPDRSDGNAGSVIAPEYKGWGWTELARHEGTWTGVVQWQ